MPLDKTAGVIGATIALLAVVFGIATWVYSVESRIRTLFCLHRPPIQYELDECPGDDMTTVARPRDGVVLCRSSCALPD